MPSSPYLAREQHLPHSRSVMNTLDSHVSDSDERRQDTQRRSTVSTTTSSETIQRRTSQGRLISQRVQVYETPMPVKVIEPRRVHHQSIEARIDGGMRVTALEPRDDAPDDHLLDVKFSKTFIGSSLIASGVNHYNEGDYDMALRTFQMALKQQRERFGDKDMSVALTLGNLGSVYLQQKSYDDAEKVLLKALEIKQMILPAMIVADTLNNLGNCANLKGDYEQSLLYYRDALTDLRKKGGRRSDVANTLFNVGRLEIQQRHWDNATNALTMSCQLSKEIFGTDNAFVAHTLDMIGYVQLSTGQFNAAMISFTGALSIFRRLNGPLNEEVANALFNVGLVREAKGDLEDAWEAFAAARDLLVNVRSDPNHPRYDNVLQILRNVEDKLGIENQGHLDATQATEASHGR